MIIFGTNSRNKKEGGGEFYCPQCGGKRQYVKISSRPHFSLYFVPLIPIGDATEYIECQTCGVKLAMDALDYMPPQPEPDLAFLLNNIEGLATRGVPFEYIVRKLTAAGLDYDIAKTNVDTKIGQRARRYCEQCGLTYIASVNQCFECENELPKGLLPSD